MQVACFLSSNSSRSEPIVIAIGSKKRPSAGRKFIDCTVAACLNGTCRYIKGLLHSHAISAKLGLP